MSTTVALREPEFDSQRLFEVLASHYLDVLDETGKALRTKALVASFCENHPNYDRLQLEALVDDPDWDVYLRGRRQNHLINRTAAKLVAAEMGGRMGVRALEEAQRRLEECPDKIEDKDLQGYIKVGMELNKSIDKDLTEVTGDAKVTIQIKDVLIGLPPERAAVLMAEYGRRQASPKAKGEVIDGTCSSE